MVQVLLIEKFKYDLESSALSIPSLLATNPTLDEAITGWISENIRLMLMETLI
jgi:hypothetical protein